MVAKEHMVAKSRWFAVLALLAIPSEASAQVTGKTLQARFQTVLLFCTSGNESCQTTQTISMNVNVYFGSGGQVFDYASGSQGEVVRVNQLRPISGGSGGFFVSGNTVNMRTVLAGTSDMTTSFHVRGNTCTISAHYRPMGPGTEKIKVRSNVETSFCRLVDGRADR